MSPRHSEKDDKFLKELEAAVTAILADEKAKRTEKLKAIEAGAKLLAIRHRLEGGEDDDGGSYFGGRTKTG